jgi:hypothetical protein
MKLLHRLNSLATLFGFNAVQLRKALRGLPIYLRNKRSFYVQYHASDSKAFPPGKLYPCLTDRFDAGGTASGAYFHQDLIVANMIYRNNPMHHIDVGSRIDGFVAHVASFREIEVLDIRPTPGKAKNIVFRQADITKPSSDLAECTDSLSCLHVIEHFGLGRYCDELDYDGYRKGLESLVGMLKPGGKLYLSVPIGKVQRFEFDAHRVFSLPYLLNMIDQHGLRTDTFAYIDDEGELHENVDPRGEGARSTFDLEHGCGVLQLSKPLADSR